jgi:hypothetical protein
MVRCFTLRSQLGPVVGDRDVDPPKMVAEQRPCAQHSKKSIRIGWHKMTAAPRKT